MAQLGSTNINGNLIVNDDGTIGKDFNVAGEITGSKVHGAVWNDYSDFWPLAKDEKLVYGKCYSQTEKGLKITSKRGCKTIIGIASDTYGYSTGNKINAVPISIGGFVLAHVDKVYKIGTLLTSNKHGILTKANWIEILLNRIVGKYIKNISYIKHNNINVNNRHWIKVI